MKTQRAIDSLVEIATANHARGHRFPDLTRGRAADLDHPKGPPCGSAWTAEKTVKVYRGRMMKKMGVRTVADQIRVVTAHRS